MLNLSDFDRTQCIWWLAYGLDEHGSFLLIVKENIRLLISSFVFRHAMPRIQYVPVLISTSKYPSEVEINGISPSSVVAGNVWR